MATKKFKKRFIIVSGPVGSGKTTLALNIAKNSGNCYYFDKDDLVPTSMATFRAVDKLVPEGVDIGYDRSEIALCDRHSQFFKDFIRNPEYDSTRDVRIKGLQFSLTTAVGLFQSVICVIFLLLANWISRKLGERGIW